MSIALQHEPTTDLAVSTVASKLVSAGVASSPSYNAMVLSLLHQSAAGG